MSTQSVSSPAAIRLVGAGIDTAALAGADGAALADWFVGAALAGTFVGAFVAPELLHPANRAAIANVRIEDLDNFTERLLQVAEAAGARRNPRGLIGVPQRAGLGARAVRIVGTFTMMQTQAQEFRPQRGAPRLTSR